MTELQNEQNIQTSNSSPIKENKNDNVSIYFSIIWIILFIIWICSIRVWGPTLAWIFLWPCFIIIWFIRWIMGLFRKPKKKVIIPIIISIFICFLIIKILIPAIHYGDFCYNEWIRNWKYISYYNNWQIKKTWNCKKWEQDWYRVNYYENGNIYHECNYKNWEKYWKCFYYYENWDFKEEYYNNWIIQKEIWYYKNWQIKHIINVLWVKNNIGLIVESKEYYENGNIQHYGLYKGWSQIWKQIYYYENGNIRMEFNMSEWWRTDWKRINYYKNGQIKEEMYYDNWVKVWKRVKYNEDGSIKSIKEY